MGRPKNLTTERNKNYWLDKGMSEEEATFQVKKYTPGCFEYYHHNKGLSEADSIQTVSELRKRRSVTLENMIRKYGFDLGTKKWEEYRTRQSITNTFEYKRDTFGWTQEQFDEYNLSRSVTLENMIRRHGPEEGPIKWQTYLDRQAFAGCKLEYFIEKYGEVAGTEKYEQINFFKSHSFESYLFKCDNDVEKATEQYLNRIKTVRTPYSNIANELFDHLFDNLKKLNYHKIFYSNNIGEWYVYDNNRKRTFFLDFYFRELRRGIEFNGDYWHANPKKYKPNTEIKFPNNVIKITDEIWSEEVYKLELFKRHPDIDEVLVIWEDDFRTNKQLIIEQCLKFLLHQ